jgi:hypothetical protein
MAKTVLTNPQITVGGVNLSTWIDQVEIHQSYADVDTTAFGAGAKTRIAGLGDHKLTLEFQQDFSSGGPEATILPLVGSSTSFVILPLAAATSTTNPAYSGFVLITEWPDLSGKIGDLEKASVTWPISGAVTQTL